MFNPYNLIFTYYVKEDLKNIPITKDRRDNVIFLFNSWVDEIFCESFFLIETNNNRMTKKIMEKMIDFKTNDETKLPEDKIIQRVLSECEKEQFMNFDIKNVYQTSSAKKVYSFFKKHFMTYNIDPFSFTNNKLTDTEKMSFLHDII